MYSPPVDLQRETEIEADNLIMVVGTWRKYVQGITQENRCILSNLRRYNYLCPLSFLPFALDSCCASFDIELRLCFLQGASLELGQSQLLLL